MQNDNSILTHKGVTILKLKNTDTMLNLKKRNTMHALNHKFGLIFRQTFV